MASVFVTGGTGYIGRPLIGALHGKGYRVHALVRPGSEARLPAGAVPVIGNVLDESTFASVIPSGATLIHLVGTPHPNPSKATEFRQVDLASIRAAAAAAQRAGVRHLIYVSVAQPAPVMQAYIAARQEGEAIVRASGIPATILRPWYVLGPGHRWPYALLPIYALLRLLPATRASAERLGLVTLDAMVAALMRAVAEPPAIVRRLEAELNSMVQTPEVGERLERSGAEPRTSTAAELAKLVRTEIENYKKVVKSAGIKIQ